jgi:hypothetical protein
MLNKQITLFQKAENPCKFYIYKGFVFLPAVRTGLQYT